GKKPVEVYGEFFGVDEEPRPSLPGNCRTIVGMPDAIHAPAQSDLPQKLDAARLQHAGTNSLQHMGAALPFQYNAVDAVSIEKMGQQQARGATADDRHLGSRRHYRGLLA